MLVYRSIPRTLGLFVGALVLTGLSLAMVAASWGNWARILILLISLVGVLLFGLGIVKIGRQLFRRGPVIEVGPAGVRDVRLSEQVIPWTVVRNIRQVAVQRQVFVTLDLDPAFEREFLSGGAGLMQRLNNVSGFPGVHISRNGLAVSAELLYQTIEREWRSFLESR